MIWLFQGQIVCVPQVNLNIVTHNNADTIAQCLHAAQAQQDIYFQILVIDNASTDNTVALIESMHIEVIGNKVNVGYAAAHNQAIAQTNSPYVLTLNPDVLLNPTFLKHCVSALAANLELGAVAGCLLRVDHLGDDPSVVDSTGLFMRRNRRQGLMNEGLLISDRPRKPAFIFGPDGAAAVYRRTMLEDIAIDGEVFDEDFFMHKEDVDVCWRAQLRGWKAIYVPDAIAHHIRTFRPGQRQRVTGHLRYLGFRNRYLLMLKNESMTGFMQHLIWIVLYDSAILAYLIAFEPQTLKAFASIWQLRKKMFYKRKRIKLSRNTTWQQMQSLFHT